MHMCPAVYPDLSSREMEVPVAAINAALGTDLPASQVTRFVMFALWTSQISFDCVML